MKVVGLITEYNPFHNGHQYHINEAKRITGADYVIAVMSGNFVQRGTPAIIDKYSRAEMALRHGIDLVLELPVCYATGSAEYFAHGAVAILDKIGVVNYLCFGSEVGDIHLLTKAAQFLTDTPAAYDERLQSFLKDGLTFPAARLKALLHTLEEMEGSDGQALAKLLTEPNNILGIEYIKALIRLSSSIEPVTIQRISAHYHDKELSGSNTLNDNLSLMNITACQTDDMIISSATAIRRAIQSKVDPNSIHFTELKDSVPDDVYRLLVKQHLKTYPITEEDFAQIIKYKLMSENKQSLTDYVDITEDLADRLLKIPDFNLSISDLCQYIKTKNYTLTRINRALIHLLLNLKNEAFEEYNQHGYSSYARVLGVKKEATHLLRRMEDLGKIPVITKVSKAKGQLDSLGMSMLSEDIFAAHLYNRIVYDKYTTAIPNEYKHGLIIL